MWFFASDLHGRRARYRALFERVRAEAPEAVLLGGDLLPSGYATAAEDPGDDFVESVLRPGLAAIQAELGERAPRVLMIPGNDDPKSLTVPLESEREAWQWAHGRRIDVGGVPVHGYGCVPPTPFHLKDWERYDVSRYVDPGCVAPEDGWFSVAVDKDRLPWRTIQAELEELAGARAMGDSVWLFHSPPHATALDRAALDDVRVEGVAVDVHIGSIAIRRFIESRAPRVTLHGHVHEAARISGTWRERIGPTWCFGAAHDGPELCLVRFDPREPESATRELIAAG